MDGGGYPNDVALCYLTTAVDIDDENVKVEVNFDGDFLANGDILRAIGMGNLAYGGSLPEILQWVDLPYVDADTCNGPESYNGLINENIHICAGYLEGGKDTCHGEFSKNPTMRRSIGL